MKSAIFVSGPVNNASVPGDKVIILIILLQLQFHLVIMRLSAH